MASLPKPATRRAIAIQLADPIKNCKVPVEAILKMDFNKTLSGTKCRRCILITPFPLNKWYTW